MSTKVPIKVQVLKVHINCGGCKDRVKKLLRKIEGVYTVDIDTEQQKVTVIGSVDSDILIKKLEKSGKHAEIWPPNNYQIQHPDQDIRRGQHPIMANTVADSDNMHMGAIDGYNMGGGDSMMGFQGFRANLPSFEHHHPPSYMASNMQGGPLHNQQFPMMNMDMQPMNFPMMNRYMHVRQPPRTNYASSPFTTNHDCYGNFSLVPYMANL